jgi:hypothetical protein
VLTSSNQLHLIPKKYYLFTKQAIFTTGSTALSHALQ